MNLFWSEKQPQKENLYGSTARKRSRQIRDGFRGARQNLTATLLDRFTDIQLLVFEEFLRCQLFILEIASAFSQTELARSIPSFFLLNHIPQFSLWGNTDIKQPPLNKKTKFSKVSKSILCAVKLPISVPIKFFFPNKVFCLSAKLTFYLFSFSLLFH